MVNYLQGELINILSLLKLPIAFLLDILLGDPYHFPHPVRIIGWLIKKLERLLYPAGNKKAAGTILTLTVVSATWFTTWIICSLSPIFEIIIIYTIFAINSLRSEAMKIYRSLKQGSTEDARRQISFLVSRDTNFMSREEIAGATVETVSENIVDAVIAPLLFLLIGGAPLAMAYKAINTLDSMVGYKNEQYHEFGRPSARLDDMANFIPARLAGFLLVPLGALLGGFDPKRSLAILRRDRLKHSSPNSGHTEAAVAGALGIQLGGPARYFGKEVKKPYIGTPLQKLDEKSIVNSVKIMLLSSMPFLSVCIIADIIKEILF